MNEWNIEIFEQMQQDFGWYLRNKSINQFDNRV